MTDEDKKAYGRIILVSSILIISSVILVIFLCHFNSGICALANFELMFGIIIGVITTASFFVFIEKHQNKLDSKLNEFLAGTYSIRTDMYNLGDVFEGKAHKIQPNETNRKIFVKQLGEHIKDYELKNDKIIVPIWEKAKKHENKIADLFHDKEKCPTCIDQKNKQKEHWKKVFAHQATCEECKNIGEMIQGYIKDKKNPLQVDQKKEN